MRSSAYPLNPPLLPSKNYKPVSVLFSKVGVTLLDLVTFLASRLVIFSNILAISAEIGIIDLFGGGSGSSGCWMLYRSSGIIGTAKKIKVMRVIIL